MGVEIERKFLVHADKLPPLQNGSLLSQGYLSDDPAVRVRVVDNSCAYLTVKGPGLLERAEFEYKIPVEDGLAMLTLAHYSLSKVRFRVGPWEIDRFRGPLEGLILAEIELPSAEASFDRPDWLDREVTTDPQFSNLSLARDSASFENFAHQLLHVWTRIGDQAKQTTVAVERLNEQMSNAFKSQDEKP